HVGGAHHWSVAYYRVGGVVHRATESVLERPAGHPPAHRHRTGHHLAGGRRREGDHALRLRLRDEHTAPAYHREHEHGEGAGHGQPAPPPGNGAWPTTHISPSLRCSNGPVQRRAPC